MRDSSVAFNPLAACFTEPDEDQRPPIRIITDPLPRPNTSMHGRP